MVQTESFLLLETVMHSCQKHTCFLRYVFHCLSQISTPPILGVNVDFQHILFIENRLVEVCWAHALEGPPCWRELSPTLSNWAKDLFVCLYIYIYIYIYIKNTLIKTWTSNTIKMDSRAELVCCCLCFLESLEEMKEMSAQVQSRKMLLQKGKITWGVVLLYPVQV